MSSLEVQRRTSSTNFQVEMGFELVYGLLTEVITTLSHVA